MTLTFHTMPEFYGCPRPVMMDTQGTRSWTVEQSWLVGQAA